MKILQIHNSYLEEGGEDRLARVEAAALRDRGDEVISAHVSNPDRFTAQALNLLISPWNPMSAKSIGSLADEHQPDLAHVHNTWYRYTPSVIAALKDRGIPVVATVHNYRMMCANGLFFRDGAPCTDCLGKRPWRAVAHRCYRNSASESLFAAGTIALHQSLNTWENGVDRFIVATRFVRDLLAEAGFSRDRMRLVPPLVLDSGPRSRAPSRSHSVVCLGRVAEGKGLEMLFDAWRSVPPSLELVIIGDGPLRPRLEALAVPRTRFLGWQERSQVDEILRTSRAMVFPSAYYETLGLGLAEAMVAGLPIIAGAVGTRPEVVGDNGAGWLVDAGDVNAWTQALSAVTDDVLVDNAGQSSRARFDSEFAPAMALERLQAVYGEVARR